MKYSATRYGLEDLERLCREKTKEMGGVVGEKFQLAWPAGKGKLWDFRDWEIEWFMRAYREYSLSTLEPHIGGPTKNWPKGCPCVRYGGRLMAVKKNGEPYTHEFLPCWERPNTNLYKPEDIVQMCAAGKLVGVYHQPAERLLLEAPLYADDLLKIRGRRGYAIDLAVFDGSREAANLVIGAEMKVTREDHDALVNAMKRCGGRLFAKEACGNDHNKCLWIRQNRTVKYLWVCSRGNEDLYQQLFEVRRAADEGFDLKEVSDSQAIHSILSRQDWN